MSVSMMQVPPFIQGLAVIQMCPVGSHPLQAELAAKPEGQEREQAADSESRKKVII